MSRSPSDRPFKSLGGDKAKGTQARKQLGKQETDIHRPLDAEDALRPLKSWHASSNYVSKSAPSTPKGSPHLQRKPHLLPINEQISEGQRKGSFQNMGGSRSPGSEGKFKGKNKIGHQHVSGHVPKILITEHGAPDEDFQTNVTVSAFALGRRGSLSNTGSSSSLASDSGSEKGLNSHLPPLRQRPRSNSLPVIDLPPLTLTRRPWPNGSPDVHQTPKGLQVVDTPRSRSSSFTGIVPARRRKSITEQWGSLSERQKYVPKRRGSIDIGNLVRDLSFGVEHKELMEPEYTTSISDEQWKDLRKCRYLRLPEDNNSQSDSEN